MDLAKQIVDQCFTRQEAQTKLLELQEEAEKEFFGKEKVDPGDRLAAFVTAGKAIEAIPEVVVYGAVTLPLAAQERLGKKAREIFGRDLFLEFKIDPGLWGGAALAWEGQYKDYSLKARLAAKKQEVKEILDVWLQKSVL